MALFAKAVKHESKLRLAVTGPSGSGKTYTSLAIASALADGNPVAVVDTEHGSASKYADLFAFDVVNMVAPFHPDRFVEMIREAAASGYAVIVLDSLTHAWQGTGGMLDLVDEIAKRKTGGNGFAAWKDATPIQNRLIDAIVGAPIHVIATMRSKQDYVQDKDDRGKTQIRKVGMAAQQREGFEYEFDVVMDMDIDNNGIVSKTRCPALTARVFSKPGRDVAGILADWLRGAPAPTPANNAPATITPPPAPQNGNGNGGSSAPATLDAKTLRHLHAVGNSLYGQEWDAKRKEIVKAATKGRTDSSKELHQSEADYLIGRMEAKLQAQMDAINMADAAEVQGGEAVPA